MPFIYPVQNADQVNLQGKTLVVPVVSVANIGQLAVDLLIATFDLQRFAILDPQYCIPLAGAREDSQDGVTTPLEIYGDNKVDFVVIQQRSPVLKLRKQDYVDALLDFIKTNKFGAVLFLGGVDLSERMDSQMITPTHKLLPPNGPSPEGTPLSTLNSLPIPTYTSRARQVPEGLQDTAVPGNDTSLPFIPGGGITRRILGSLPSQWGIPTASLLQFVVEGDNRADAGLFASAVAMALGRQLERLRQPDSWRDGLFGTPHDQSLYG
ncbi:PAC2 family-domain-containing protein [Panaeolus papilionaceus]|nr:PAC2 family-domain-containing protein [Panaeolus papilionaceus]